MAFLVQCDSVSGAVRTPRMLQWYAVLRGRRRRCSVARGVVRPPLLRGTPAADLTPRQQRRCATFYECSMRATPTLLPGLKREPRAARRSTHVLP